MPGVEVKLADDGEVLIRGENGSGKELIAQCEGEVVDGEWAQVKNRP